VPEAAPVVAAASLFSAAKTARGGGSPPEDTSRQVATLLGALRTAAGATRATEPASAPGATSAPEATSVPGATSASGATSVTGATSAPPTPAPLTVPGAPASDLPSRVALAVAPIVRVVESAPASSPGQQLLGALRTLPMLAANAGPAATVDGVPVSVDLLSATRTLVSGRS
jgi:hypothetical protein